MIQRSLILSLLAVGSVGAYRFVTVGSTSGSVEQASGGDAMIIGATGQVGAADGTTVDVTISDIADVDCAATIAAGTLVTSDTDGKAVAATTGDWIGGIAVTNGRAGSRISVLQTRAKI